MAGHDTSEIPSERRGLVKKVEANHIIADGADNADLIRRRGDPIEVVSNSELKLLLDIVKGLRL